MTEATNEAVPQIIKCPFKEPLDLIQCIYGLSHKYLFPVYIM